MELSSAKSLVDNLCWRLQGACEHLCHRAFQLSLDSRHLICELSIGTSLDLILNPHLLQLSSQCAQLIRHRVQSRLVSSHGDCGDLIRPVRDEKAGGNLSTREFALLYCEIYFDLQLECVYRLSSSD